MPAENVTRTMYETYCSAVRTAFRQNDHEMQRRCFEDLFTAPAAPQLLDAAYRSVTDREKPGGQMSAKLFRAYLHDRAQKMRARRAARDE